MIKPLDLNKKSGFETKQFETKDGPATNEFPTKQYGKQGNYRDSREYPTREFSHSSKSFNTKTARDSSKAVATPEVPAKTYEEANKQFETKTVATKEARTKELPHQIADKPTTNWQTLIRKEPPTGLPGAHSDLPFSQWKAVSEEKK